jgi:hypothetical protein
MRRVPLEGGREKIGSAIFKITSFSRLEYIFSL